MKRLIIVILMGIVASASIINDSTQDIQRAMRSQRARKTRRRKELSLQLFMDY